MCASLPRWGFSRLHSYWCSDKEFSFQDKSNQRVWWGPTNEAIPSMLQRLEKSAFRYMTVFIFLSTFRLLAFFLSQAPGIPWLVATEGFQISASVFTWLLLCVCVSPLLCLVRTLSLDVGPPSSRRTSSQILHFITSAETLFPNKVPFPGPWCQGVHMSLWGHHSTHCTLVAP